ncbi:uncharacterized protein [Nicotiana sylvestris]|uniref:uncharacterized protein n=1 Tax=Nicotiana sylvestris TaxID=4096 RepID=UPI00388C8B1E
MVVPPNFEEGQSTYRPCRFNGQYYGRWKTRMHDFIMAEDSELWDIICNGPHDPMKKLEETGPMVPKNRKEYMILIENLWKRTIAVKQSKIDMLTIEYELFRMKDDESIQDIHTRFTSIINELHSLRDVIPRKKLVRKILSVLPGLWESKVNAITKAKDLQTLTMDELICNLKTYEMKRKKDSEIREPKKEKNLVLKAESSDSSDEDSDMAYLTKRFQKMVRRNCGIPKRGSSSKVRNNDLCHRCGKTRHFIKNCPLAKQEQYKQNADKAAKRNLVPDKRFNRKSAADNIVKQALAAWGDSSSESEREPDEENSSMIAVETKATNLDNDKEILTLELGEAEQSRDDLVVCVVDLNETISNFEKGKEALNEKITSVENKRDDLMVVVVDLKKTIEGLNKEKHTLEENISATEQERDDFLVIITNLEETIEGLNREHKTGSLEKGKEVVSETHIKLEHGLNNVKTRLCGELEKNRQLQAELEKVKIDLQKSLKWTWSSDAMTAMYLNNSGNSAGKVEKSLCHSNENVYYVDGLKYSLLSVSQICVEGNKVEFLSKECTTTNLVTDKMVLVAKRKQEHLRC